MAAHLAERGPALIARGYPTVPILPGKKHPGLDGWQDIEATPAHLPTWLANGYAKGGVGILAERFPGIDIDVLDEDIAAKILGMVLEEVCDAFDLCPVRYGNRPKCLVPCRTDEPFAKVTSRTFRDPEGRTHKVEILGRGQQWVAYHEHPDTGRPYEFEGGELSEIDPQALPEITEAKAHEIVEKAEEIMLARGWEPKRGKTETAPAPCARDPFNDIRPKTDLSDLEVRRTLAGILERADDYGDWIMVGQALHHQYDGDAVGLALWEEWSQESVKFRPGVCEQKWRGFSAIHAGGSVTFATVIQWGKEARTPQRESHFYSAASLKGKHVPPREWLVPDLIPQRNVTLLSGDGAAGKSLLALQLAVAVTARTPWLNKTTSLGGAFYLSAEDDGDELHRRLDDILQAEGREYDDLAKLTLRSLAGEDALLALEGRLALTQSTLFEELETRAAQEAPALIVIDTLADVYPANENDRAKVRQFVSILRGLAIRQKCAVLLLGHPSLTGLSSGTGTSGSTAWNNSVRSRLYLQRVVTDGYEQNPDARILSTKKANYTRTGSEPHLRWEAGRFVAALLQEATNQPALSERVFLKLLGIFTEQGRYVSPNTGGTYAPAQFAAHPGAEGCTKRALKAAMEALLQRGEIIVAHHGSGAKRRSHLAEKDCDSVSR